MFGPDWEAGCKSCSFWADNYDRIVVHLNARDTNLVTVSRAPYERLAAYKKRMGWSFEWVSSLGNSFNHDFAVSFPDAQAREGNNYNFGTIRFDGEEAPGLSVFARGRRRYLPHLLDLCARPRHAQRRLSPARPRAEGPRRGRL